VLYVLRFTSDDQCLMSPFQLVTKSSAVVPGAVNTEAIVVNKDHSGMAKYSSSGDDDFQTICWHISEMVSMAPQKIAQRWKEVRSWNR
jgi:hypothetical protein